MEIQGVPLDMMSNLPPSIIQTILTLMPMRDAFRTCVLSHNWRDHCLKIPKLEFDDTIFNIYTCVGLSIKWELLQIVYPILLLHQGPIIEFSLCSYKLTSCREINQIILHLSRNSTLKKFTLLVVYGDDHKLLPSFFNLQHLTVLNLQNYVFQPPSTFKGFSKLVTLSFNNVSITAEVLLHFISSCPLLKDFTLIGTAKYTVRCENFGFVELFESLLLMEHLCISSYHIKKLAALQDYSYVIPSHLRVLKITNFTGTEIEMDLVKFLLSRSPVLKEVYIVIDQSAIHNEVKMLKELLQLPRVSANAKIML